MHRNLLIVLVGHDRNSSFLIYREIMQKMATLPQIKKSFLYFGVVEPLDLRDWMKRRELKRVPLLLVYYQNRLVARIDVLPGKSKAQNFLEQLAFRSMIYSFEDESAGWYYRKMGLLEHEFKAKNRVEGGENMNTDNSISESDSNNETQTEFTESQKTQLALNTGFPLNTKQLEILFAAVNDLRAHTIFFTQRMPIFDDTINHRGKQYIQNQVNPLMYFDEEYTLNQVEKTIFYTVISLTEDDFNYVYVPSQEMMVKVSSIERPDEQALLYIHSRKYDITHAMTDPGILFIIFTTSYSYETN